MPELGGYVSPDPLHMLSISNPGVQTYAYATARPLTALDPDGRLMYIQSYGTTVTHVDQMSNPNLLGTFDATPSWRHRAPCKKRSCDSDEEPKWGFDVDVRLNGAITILRGPEVRSTLSHELSHFNDYVQTFRSFAGTSRDPTEGWSSEAQCNQVRDHQFSLAGVMAQYAINTCVNTHGLSLQNCQNFNAWRYGGRTEVDGWYFENYLARGE